jgi:hypothetical protein
MILLSGTDALRLSPRPGQPVGVAWDSRGIAVLAGVLSQLPTERAHAPGMRQYDLVGASAAAAAADGELHPAASSARGVELLVTITIGVASQEGRQRPGPGSTGRFTALLEPTLDMYVACFHPERPGSWTPWVAL